MLSGMKDEVVPAEHMQGLWEIVKRRDAGLPSGPPVRRSSSSSKSGEAKNQPRLTTKEGQNPGVTARVEDTRTLSKFLEFEDGAHSESFHPVLLRFAEGLDRHDCR